MVNLAFPLGLIKSGLDIAGQFVPEYLPKVDAIRESVTAGFRGTTGRCRRRWSTGGDHRGVAGGSATAVLAP